MQYKQETVQMQTNAIVIKITRTKANNGLS